MRCSLALPYLAAICVALTGCAGGGIGGSGINKQYAGAAMGGAVGGLAGAQFGSGTAQLAATAAGVMVGALVGGAVGQYMDQQDQARTRQALEAGQTGRTTSWRNPNSGNEYAFTPTRTYQSPTGPCRDYVTEGFVQGKRQTVYGTACRGADGQWKIQSQR
jgi:surface antigen